VRIEAAGHAKPGIQIDNHHIIGGPILGSDLMACITRQAITLRLALPAQRLPRRASLRAPADRA
jgi:hypothetical protein